MNECSLLAEEVFPAMFSHDSDDHFVCLAEKVY